MSYSIDAKCDGCSACAGQCPTGAIRGELNHVYAIDPARCIDCGVCGLICPVEAVRDAAGQLAQRVPRRRRPRPQTDPSACVGCAACIDACPFECRRLVGHTLDGLSRLALPDRCTGCGECARACLKGAILLVPFDLATFDPAVEEQHLREILGL